MTLLMKAFKLKTIDIIQNTEYKITKLELTRMPSTRCGYTLVSVRYPGVEYEDIPGGKVLSGCIIQ